jgi:dTDP-4-amino-4,6-dideoxygalactose transaminase
METLKIIPFSPPDITQEEIDEVIDVLKSGWITTGPKTKLFEKQIASYVGVNKAVVLNSWTAAAELSLHILGIGEGDEVITSAYTYTASASIIHHVGAKIVLVDTAPGSFEMDYDQLERAITEKTKMIIPVDIAGIICNYDRIYQAVENKKHLFNPNNDKQKAIGRITILADAAHSFGAIRNGKKSGLHADITCFSFHAVKNPTSAEGGAVVWQHSFGMTEDELYKEFMLYSLHGQSKDALAKTQKGAWEYDVIYPGYKCNMTDVLASIGLIQLKRHDDLMRKRLNYIRLYEAQLEKTNVEIIKHYGDNFVSSGHLLFLNINGYNENRRNQLIFDLAEKGITTNVHYKPLPMFTAYKKLGFRIDDFPNAYEKYKNIITLPLHTKLTEQDIDYVCTEINDLTKGLYNV